MNIHKFKSEMPELIDLKITDYCENGCLFCYQGSTPSGKHANTEFIKNLIYLFRKMGVFEVVIGGGDVTKHPDLIEILEECRRHSLVPNMTVSSHQIDWLITKNGKKAADLLGSLAISASEPEHLNKFFEQMEKFWGGKEDHHNIRIQAVEELYTNEQLMKFLKFQDTHYKCGVTFVGYKPTGRGMLFGGKKNSNLIQVIKDFFEECKKEDLYCFDPISDWFTCSIDTILAKKYEKELVEILNVDPKQFNTYDGLNSCYIDAVNKTMNESSYSNKPGIYIGYDEKDSEKWHKNDPLPGKQLLEIFSTFTEE